MFQLCNSNIPLSYLIFSLFLFFAFTYFILFSYDRKWFNKRGMWLLLAIVSFIGMLGLVYCNDERFYILFVGLSLQFFHYVLIQILRRISIRIYKRPFLLTSRFGNKKYRSGIDIPFVRKLPGYQSLPEVNLYDELASIAITAIPLLTFMICISL